MLRILLVLEDYGELMFLQTVLKKIGFDVDSIQNPRSFQDSLLSMNPDVLVMTAQGKRVKGMELCKGVKRVRGVPRLIMLHQGSQTHDDEAMVDGWLTSPVGAVDLLNMVGDLCGLDKAVLSDKFHKLRITENSEDGNRILHIHSPDEDGTLEPSVDTKSGFVPEEKPAPAPKPAAKPAPTAETMAIAPTTMTANERAQRYKKFTAETPAHIGFTVKQVQEQIKTLRKIENPEERADLERERKAFVNHLFTKKKSG